MKQQLSFSEFEQRQAHEARKELRKKLDVSVHRNHCLTGRKPCEWNHANRARDLLTVAVWCGCEGCMAELNQTTGIHRR